MSSSVSAPASPVTEAVYTALPVRRKRRGLSGRLLDANLWLIFVFFYAPILVLVLFSFNSGRFVNHWEGFSWRWYVTLFQNKSIALALENSLIVAAVSTVVSTVLATLVAVGMERFNFSGKLAMDSVL
jgi:spermidine/putrescine transport system permease protein